MQKKVLSDPQDECTQIETELKVPSTGTLKNPTAGIFKENTVVVMEQNGSLGIGMETRKKMENL